ncbi:MAG: hydrogenase maturation protein [Betaproteobacteria bacterium]|nr:hydrogenase maturation protein [Betaproteobacteria bacterium]
MRILFLTRSFNGLAQRLYLELTALGHEVAIEFDISDAVTTEAVALWRPALVVAPFLQRAIPEAVWRHTVCLVVHPGIVGDRGPSALDWAVAEGVCEWGVTVLQAEAEMDAGPVWASQNFAMREATKSSLYRQEVTEAAARAVVGAVQRFAATGAPPPAAGSGTPRGRWRPLMKQADRAIDWPHDDTRTVLRKIRAADGAPGVRDELFGLPCHLFDARALPPPPSAAHAPGQVVGRRQQAVLRATCDGLVAIGHVRRADGPEHFKLPATLAFLAETAALDDWPTSVADGTDPDIRLEAIGDGVLALHFDFYNGAVSTTQCQRLRNALRDVLARPPRVLVLFGGTDFWCNGIHLNVIEAAASPADESWRNINAIDDLTQTLIEATDCLVVAAMQGSAGAGGVFMALAADVVWARPGVVLNPHYKNMGNLYGSEYWTYLLPRRPGSPQPAEVMGRRLPLSAGQAQALGLVDEVFGDSPAAFRAEVLARARRLAADPDLPARLQAKRRQRLHDEALKPLAAYRDEELARMRRNFYGFDPSYHIARSNFVRRVAPSWTPRHLAIHRDPARQGASAAPATLDQDQDSGQA